MRIRRNSYLAITSLLLGMFLFVDAGACSYDVSPNPPIEYIVSRTETIFLGKVIDRKTRIEKIDGERTKVISIAFKIERLIKGKQAKQFRLDYYDYISRRDSCYDAPPNPKYGEKWVVFSGYDEGNDGVTLVRGADHLSSKYTASEHDKQDLEKTVAAVQNQSNTFYGEVNFGFFGSPPSDDLYFKAELWTSDAQKLIKSVDIRKGQFEISDYAPGSYVLRLHSVKESGFNFPETVRMRPHTEGGFFADFKISLSPNYPEYKYFSLY